MEALLASYEKRYAGMIGAKSGFSVKLAHFLIHCEPSNQFFSEEGGVSPARAARDPL